jgi:hypothetical protein
VNEAIQQDPDLRNKLEGFDQDAFNNTSTSGSGRKNPSSQLQWDHNNTDKNRLDLVPSDVHKKKTQFDNKSGKGGGFTRHGGKNRKLRIIKCPKF